MNARSFDTTFAHYTHADVDEGRRVEEFLEELAPRGAL